MSRPHAQELLVRVVPGGRQVGRRQLAAHHRQLHPEAHGDVQVVGHLVRLDPDQRRRHPVDVAVHIVDVHAGHRLGERLAHQRCVPLPERPAAADDVLPQAGLRLVDAVRGRLGDRRVLVRRVEALLVQAVAALVDRGEQPAERVELVDPGRQADVAQRRGRAERVRRHVLPPGVQVEAEVAEHLDREGPLRIGGKGASLERRRRQLPGGLDLAQQAEGLVAQLAEQRLQPRGGHPRFELVEQRVVRLAVVPDQLGLFALQLDDLLERRQERREVVLAASDPPDGRPPALGERQPLGELDRQLDGALMPVPQVADHGRAGRIRVAGQLLEQLAQARVADPLVVDAAHGRLLARPRLRRAQRHLRLLVPAEQFADVREVGQLAHPRVQRSPGVDVDHPIWRLPQRRYHATVSASTAAPARAPRCEAAPTKSRKSG